MVKRFQGLELCRRADHLVALGGLVGSTVNPPSTHRLVSGTALLEDDLNPDRKVRAYLRPEPCGTLDSHPRAKPSNNLPSRFPHGRWSPFAVLYPYPWPTRRRRAGVSPAQNMILNARDRTKLHDHQFARHMSSLGRFSACLLQLSFRPQRRSPWGSM